jgi:hypothetical protein
MEEFDNFMHACLPQAFFPHAKTHQQPAIQPPTTMTHTEKRTELWKQSGEKGSEKNTPEEEEKKRREGEHIFSRGFPECKIPIQIE